MREAQANRSSGPRLENVAGIEPGFYGMGQSATTRTGKHVFLNRNNYLQ